MPPRQLRVEIYDYLYRDSLLMAPIFSGCRERFVNHICVSLCPITFPTGDHVYAKGDVAEEGMYIISKGEVAMRYSSSPAGGSCGAAAAGSRHWHCFHSTKDNGLDCRGASCRSMRTAVTPAPRQLKRTMISDATAPSDGAARGTSTSCVDTRPVGVCCAVAPYTTPCVTCSLNSCANRANPSK